MRVFAWSVVFALTLAVLTWFVWQRVNQPEAPMTIATAVDSTRAGLKAARLYFAAPTGDSLVSEQRDLVDSGNVRDRAAALVGALDRGPTGRGVAALPAGTSLLHAYFDDRGLLTVDLSGAFLQSFRGGSTSEYLAIASLVRTLGENLPSVQRVLITCVGSPVATLGGHLPLDRPIEVDQLP